MKSKFRVGDLVHYNRHGNTGYCKIQRIEIRPNFNPGIIAIWGYWSYNIKIAKANYKTNHSIGYMPEHECELVEREKCRYELV